MTRIQHIALRGSSFVARYAHHTEWIAGCGTPQGECLAIPITYQTIMGQ